MPLVIPVRTYRNLADNLFVDVPLYEPLVGRKDPSKLKLSILGNGIIGTEAFLSAYWFGQMLVADGDKMKPVELEIHVVSQDDEDTFWSKIDYINPEIQDTIGTEQKPKGNPEILRYDLEGNTNPCYCKVKYDQADVKIGSFWDLKEGEVGKLLDSDYYIVALGNDADNISVAEKLRSYVGEKHLLSEAPNNVVIAYVVFDTQLCNTLNKECDNGCSHVYSYAFGSLEQIYSCENVFMTRARIWAEEVGKGYQNTNQSYAREHRDRLGNDNQNYNHWANIARAMHVKYKVFSLGWTPTSRFADPKNCRKRVAEECQRYRRLAIMPSPDKHDQEDTPFYHALQQKKDYLAWLEHRRWCAFTRTMGYRHTEALKQNLLTTESHKNMPLKLHPCLVETRLPDRYDQSGQSIPGNFFKDLCDSKKSPKEKENLERILADILHTRGRADLLDRVSCLWHQTLQEVAKDPDPDVAKKAKGKSAGDYKSYDFFTHEYDVYVAVSDFDTWLREAKLQPRTRKVVTRLYAQAKKKSREMVPGKNGVEQLIPKDVLIKALEKRFVAIDKQTKWTSQKQPEMFAYGKTWYVKRRGFRKLYRQVMVRTAREEQVKMEEKNHVYTPTG